MVTLWLYRLYGMALWLKALAQTALITRWLNWFYTGLLYITPHGPALVYVIQNARLSSQIHRGLRLSSGLDTDLSREPWSSSWKRKRVRLCSLHAISPGISARYFWDKCVSTHLLCPCKINVHDDPKDDQCIQWDHGLEFLLTRLQKYGWNVWA